MKKQIATVISELLEIDENLIEVQTPSNVEFGDFSVPCFAFAKVLRKSPQSIAQFLVEHFSMEDIEKTVAVNGYFNIFLAKAQLFFNVLNTINNGTNYIV